MNNELKLVRPFVSSGFFFLHFCEPILSVDLLLFSLLTLTRHVELVLLRANQ